MGIGLGEVEIKLMNAAGELQPVTLKPSLRATKLLSRNEGGLMATAQQIMNLNLDTFVRVIDLGVGFTEKGKEGLDQRVYDTGLAELSAPLVRFVHILINGGKPPKDSGEVDDEGEAGGNS
ncbi:hypothetical protein EVB39_043 [Rhizobium phage RHph_TM3_3_9]|nr:hypothetical protein EVB39_043 [Rhizobium phage RHph_TM3_3_9]QIG67851.1 hypothetical protein EVB53_049 [Rhizobium phage RHph_Y60]QIG68564.1 hypothetical protein EVB66_043 [Rhizobium phage RHph_TM3_3_13]QIG73357.1 hypothetical protein EVC03_049 [Rhizobium phage RHph_Y5A]QIG74422.1 hypothetical protein EVC09_042 [Rhizobium phage RHph_TM3_3_10]QIG75280.1 hypothetical protein EVC16_051 [Rhizobium phage RHph_Y21]QIG75491.1 hypothetical protein EVC18_049 [Rhizobium phage RHph_Y2_4]QIG76752.1 hy